MKIININNRMKMLLLSILFFLILFSPAVFQIIKLIPLAILSTFTFLMIIKTRLIPLEKKLLLWILVFASLNLLHLLRGTYSNLEVFIQLLPVKVIWPFVYIFALIIPTSNFYRVDFNKIFIFSTIAIEAYLFYLYFNFIGILPKSILLEINLGQSINYNFNYINLFSPSITSLFFLLPYIVSKLMISKKSFNKVFLYSSLLLFGIIISIITGRRALIIAILLSSFVSLFFIRLTKNDTAFKLGKALIIVLIIIFIMFVFITNYELGLRIQNLQNQLSQNGNTVRIDQFNSLIRGWLKYPLFGAGFGVNSDVIRSTIPGAYELSYVARLFQTGIVGILIYFFMILWIFKNLINIAKKDQNSSIYILPLLTGFTLLLIAESSNPYIGSFDGMFIMFYSLAVINNSNLKMRKNHEKN
jgi:hypothetical protein